MPSVLNVVQQTFNTSTTTQTSSASYVVPSGSNKRLVVAVLLHRAGASTASTISVTHNGVSLTQRADIAATGTPYTRVAIFDLILGDTTPSGNIVCTFSQSSRALATFFTVSDVQQSGTILSGTSTSLGPNSLTLPASGIVLYALGNPAGSSTGTYTITGCDQTQLTGSPVRVNAGASSEMNLGVATVEGSGALSATWTVNASGKPVHAAIAYEAVSSAITGTLSATLDAITLSSSGAVAIAGTASATLGEVTLSAAGALSIAGTASASLGDVTLSAAGALALAGTLSATLGAVTLTATGGNAIGAPAAYRFTAAANPLGGDASANRLTLTASANRLGGDA